MTKTIALFQQIKMNMDKLIHIFLLEWFGIMVYIVWALSEKGSAKFLVEIAFYIITATGRPGLLPRPAHNED